ncbi:MAG TPA: MauE/DoxX family redox-associated membrane protein [Acidimicrobiales bacterium]
MRGELGEAAALAVALVFALAGIAKVRSPRTTARSFASLGLRAPSVLARGVPVAEVALAVALVVAPARAGWAAACALVAFTAVLVAAVARGATASCACFGSARTAPVSTTDVARNALLLVAALLATTAPEPLAGGALPSLPALVAVTVVAAMARVVGALLDLRRDGPLWPPVPDAPAA